MLLLSIKIGAAYYPSGRDPREMAEAIRQVAGPVVEEVHFVDTNGWYGLTFYMGVEVEQVTMRDEIDSNPAYQSVWERLPDELREDAGDRVVYVVPNRRSEDFVTQLEQRELIARTAHFRSRDESFAIFGSLQKSADERVRVNADRLPTSASPVVP